MMLRQCSICRKKVKISEKCECELEEIRKKHNENSKRYREKNSEDVKLIKTARWAKLRKLIISRDGGYCQRCFKLFNVLTVDRLEVHHIKPRSEFPELVYDDKNLVTLCKRCNLDLGTQHELDFEFETRSIDHNI